MTLSTKHPFRLIAASLALVTMAAAGCSSSKPAATTEAPKPAAEAPKPAALTKIVIAQKGDPSGLDPQKNEDGNMRAVTENVYESLVTRNDKLEIVPQLAESWKMVDATTAEFKLRSGVKFQNGDPLTVDDVVFSVKRQISKDLQSDLAGTFATIKDATKVDDSTVRITTDGVDPSILSRVAWLKILDKKFLDGKDETFAQTNANGTGPYTFVKWTKGQSIELKANDTYWGTKPTIQNVTIRPIEADATRQAGLQSGEIDLATDIPPQMKDQVPVLKTAPGLEYSLMLINRFRGVFANEKLAKAAIMAIDRQSLATKLFGGLAEPYDMLPFRSVSVGFSTKAKAPAFDPEGAKKLIAEAGYKGEKVQIVGETGRFMKDGESVQAVAQMLDAVGFKTEVKMVSFQEWLKILFGRDLSPDMTYLSHSNDIFDADRTYSTYVLSDGSGSKYTNKLDEKVKAARKEADSAKRTAMYDEIGQTLADDSAWAPLVNVKNIYGLSKKIDWEPRADQKILFSTIKGK